MTPVDLQAVLDRIRTTPAHPATVAVLQVGVAAGAAGLCGWSWGWPAATGAAAAMAGAGALWLAAAWKGEAAKARAIDTERQILSDLIHKDPLTGLVNRSAFHQALGGIVISG